MHRSGWVAWSGDVVALGFAVALLASVSNQRFGPDTQMMHLAWVVVGSAAALVIFEAYGRRPPRVNGGGVVVLALVVPVVAALQVHPSLRVGAAALGLAFPLSTAAFTATVVGWSRPALGALAAVTVVGATARLVLRDPFIEVRCSPFCRSNPMLLSPHPGLVLAADRLLAVVAVGWSVVAMTHIVTSNIAMVAKASVVLVLTAGTLGAMVSPGRLGLIIGDRSGEWLPLLLVAALSGALLVAAAIELSAWRISRRVRALASDLSAGFENGGVAGHLQRAMADPSVRIVFPVAEGAFIDISGARTDVVASLDMSTTVLEWDGVPIAIVEHATRSASLVPAAVNPAVTIAAENERLHALAQAQLAELERARLQIVERADETRRHLERDLHDGAQQQLLLLGLELSRAAETSDHAGRANRQQAIAHAQGALIELRRLVHDPLPPVLDEFGLVEALRSLAEDSPIPLLLELDAAPLRRPRLSVERVAYRVALSALADAEAHMASAISVRIEERLGRFTLSIWHDGVGANDHTDDEDRVGAVGGRLEIRPVEGGITLEVSFP